MFWRSGGSNNVVIDIEKQKLLGMKDVEGRTPLDIAIEKGEVDVIKTFLKH